MGLGGVHGQGLFAGKLLSSMLENGEVMGMASHAYSVGNSQVEIRCFVVPMQRQ